MTEERSRRKLSAILSADAVGYSRLMGENENSTVQTLKAYRDNLLQAHFLTGREYILELLL
jgi:class 3 adenylate cyclase